MTDTTPPTTSITSGLVKEDLEPKPACTALKNDDGGVERLPAGTKAGGPGGKRPSFFCLSTGPVLRKAVGWTLADAHVVHLTGWQPEVSLELGPLPRYAAMASGMPSGAPVNQRPAGQLFETSAGHAAIHPEQLLRFFYRRRGPRCGRKRPWSSFPTRIGPTSFSKWEPVLPMADWRATGVPWQWTFLNTKPGQRDGGHFA